MPDFRANHLVSLLSDALQGLSPAPLWEHFSRLSSIPRPSRKERHATRYILDLAASRGFVTREDAAGNVIVRKPASKGNEGVPSVALQNHLDMVCEKRRDVIHDFERDPLRLLRADGYVIAEGTTLGADNGIGAAAAIAVMMDDALAHGPLELLFTVDEETGLNGAAALDASLLGSRLLLNLDSEEEGALYIGCAGSRAAFLSSPAEREKAPDGALPLAVVLGGLQGGHSGLEIDKVRGNAIRLMSRALWAWADDIRIVRITAGSRRNAIPREAEAVLMIRPERVEEFRRSVDRQNAIIWDEWGPFAEPHLSLRVASAVAATDGTVIRRNDQEKLLSLLCALPTGVMGMSASMPGSVETSLNLAVVRTEEKSVVTEISMRSSVDSALDDLAIRVGIIGRLAGATVDLTPGYPGWRPNPSSPLLRTVAGTYRTLFGKNPAIKAIHGGLECAVIGRKLPEIDMISFGPNIDGAHSPDERVEIASVEKFWRLLTAVLEQLTRNHTS